MLRQAFHPYRGLLDTDAARLVVSPVLWAKCRDTFLVILLLVPAAVCSPVVMAQPKRLSPEADLLTQSFAEFAAQPYPYEPLSGDLFPSATLTSAAIDNALSTDGMVVGAIRAISAQPDEGLAGPSPATNLERYPYLLLTASLILLAFRPARPSLTGRY